MKKYMKDNTIRRLCLEDIPLIINYLKHERFDCCEFKDFWSTEELHHWIADPNDICVGCFIDTKLVGFCLSHFSRSMNKVYLENIFVDSEYRGQGIASRMVSKIMEMYCELNGGTILRFVALVEESNAPAISTLKKEGFNVGDKMLWIQKNALFEI